MAAQFRSQDMTMTHHCELTNYTIIDEATHAYAFNKDCKYHWLQRLCIWVLNKLGCHYTYVGFFKYWKLARDPNNFMTAIERQREHLEYMGKPPKYLVLGLDGLSAFNYYRGPRSYISDINSESMSIDQYEWKGLRISIQPQIAGGFVLSEVNPNG